MRSPVAAMAVVCLSLLGAAFATMADEAMDTVSFIQTKQQVNLNGDLQQLEAETHLSGAQIMRMAAKIQEQSDRESKKALELAFGTLKKAGMEAGDLSNLTIRHAEKLNASALANLTLEEGKKWKLQMPDAIMEATPIFRWEAKDGTTGPFIEVRVPRISCSALPESKITQETPQGKAAAYLADRYEHCIKEQIYKARMKILIGVKVWTGDVIYFAIDSQYDLAEVGFGGWFPFKRNATKSSGSGLMFYPGVFHQHIIAIPNTDPLVPNIEGMARQTFLHDNDAGSWKDPFWTGFLTFIGGKDKPVLGGSERGVGGPYYLEVSGDKQKMGFEIRATGNYKVKCNDFTSERWCPSNYGDRCKWDQTEGYCTYKTEDDMKGQTHPFPDLTHDIKFAIPKIPDPPKMPNFKEMMAYLGENAADGAQWTAEQAAKLGSAFINVFDKVLRIPDFIENPLRNPFDRPAEDENGKPIKKKKDDPETLPLFPGEMLIPPAIRKTMQGSEDAPFSPENLQSMKVPLDVDSLKPPGFPDVDDLMGKLPMPDGLDLPDMKELKKDLNLPDVSDMTDLDLSKMPKPYEVAGLYPGLGEVIQATPGMDELTKRIPHSDEQLEGIPTNREIWESLPPPWGKPVKSKEIDITMPKKKPKKKDDGPKLEIGKLPGLPKNLKDIPGKDKMMEAAKSIAKKQGFPMPEDFGINIDPEQIEQGMEAVQKAMNGGVR